ncbi:MAG: histidine kinase [Phaeodactylibacter sp.]|nr:histidine kinase [Phaeodactylibacter sp.]MCB9302912.1 histidine kinase [Lewinellaceae bacterium]HQU58537.1 histidine kinase [Saprospiraceae bacterium]
MAILGIKINAERLFRLLFHLLFWGMLLVWPFISSAGNEEFREYVIKVFPVSLTNIPLFFLNTAWLAPKLLRKRGVAPYLLSLLALIIVFIIIQLGMREWLLPSSGHPWHRHLFITLMFVLMVTAIGTAYSLITNLVSQEKLQQEERQERLQSELAFLRSQISPHFIFNILNSIVYLIRTHSVQAEPVTIKLSELMRYMLYESADAQVPLDKEVEYLKNYVELQKLRFEEDVDIRLKIEGIARGQLIEPMLMIPFVENAFKHGVGLVSAPVIDISLRLEETSLAFSVRNKIGPELPEDKDNSSGIGLRNVKRRLELLYPDSHRLRLDREGEWFVAELELDVVRLDVAPR